MSDETLEEKVQCEHCGKEVKRRNMKAWAKLSIVTEDAEFNPIYFCSHQCLLTWATEWDMEKKG